MEVFCLSTVILEEESFFLIELNRLVDIGDARLTIAGCWYWCCCCVVWVFFLFELTDQFCLWPLILLSLSLANLALNEFDLNTACTNVGEKSGNSLASNANWVSGLAERLACESPFGLELPFPGVKLNLSLSKDVVSCSCFKGDEEKTLALLGEDDSGTCTSSFCSFILKRQPQREAYRYSLSGRVYQMPGRSWS